MPAAPDAQSLTNDAERAASAGDYISAEQYLKLTVELQDVGAGAMQPDLANTLNNLGVVCERLGKAAEAEGCYRRAYAIASAVLDADHPFVVLSAKNLRDFCDARNIPVEPPAAAPPAPPVLNRSAEPPVVSPPPQRVTRTRSPALADRRLALVGIGLLALIAVALVVARSLSTGGSATDARPVPPPAAVTAAPATRASADSAAPTADTPSPTSAPRPTSSRSSASPPVKSAIAAPTLISGGLCQTLETSAGEWQCTPASGVLQPGTVFFYTRVASPRDTTIEHRWYRNGRLHQTVPLRVGANQRSGYRTFSRMTVSDDRTGDWRVELRTAEGTILSEEHFTVGAPGVR